MSEPKPERQAVCDFQAAGLGGVAKGQGQPGGCGCRRGVDPGVRGEPEGEPLQGLESDVLGELHAAAGEGGRDTEEGRAGRECSACPLSRTGSLRRSRTCTWSPRWSRCSTRTPTGIGRDGRLMTRCGTCRQRCWRYDWVIDLDLQVVLRLARPLARSEGGRSPHRTCGGSSSTWSGG